MQVRELVSIAYDAAKSKGFHDDETTTFGDRIALVHSELSEALEAYRKSGTLEAWDNWPGSKPGGVPSELADVVIRVAHMCGCYGIDLEAAIVEKLEFNKTRPYRHGKQKL